MSKSVESLFASADVSSLFTEERLRGIIGAILRNHAEEHPTSAHTVRLRGAESKTWPEIAEAVFPAEKFEKSLEARKGDVRTVREEPRRARSQAGEVWDHE